MPRVPPRVLLALSILVLAACDRPPSADGLREWSPQDHDRGDAGQGASPAGPKGAPGPKVDEATQLAELTWSTQCSRCHGVNGRGDGPEGPMVKAADLTRKDWQARVQDRDIAATIKNGKDKMPKYDLSDPIVDALVRRIRARREP